MTTERTAEEWGWSAITLPGFTYDPETSFTSMYFRCSDGLLWRAVPATSAPDAPPVWVPDPDDPATAGCLLALLMPHPVAGWMTAVHPPGCGSDVWAVHLDTRWGKVAGHGATLGRACIAAAEALGRWPGA